MQLPDVSSGFINCYGCQRLYHVSCSHKIGWYDENLKFTCGCQSIVEATQYTVDGGFQTRKIGLDCQSDDSNEALEEANRIIAEYENQSSSVGPVGPDTTKSYYFGHSPVNPVGPVGSVLEEIIAQYENSSSSVDPVGLVGPDTRKSRYFGNSPVGPVGLVQEEIIAGYENPSIPVGPVSPVQEGPSVRHQLTLEEANRLIAEYKNRSFPVDPVGPETRKPYYSIYSPIGPVSPGQEVIHSSLPSMGYQPTLLTSSNPRNFGVKRPAGAGSELKSEKIKSIRLSTNPGDKENTCPIATTTKMLLAPAPTQSIKVLGPMPRKNYILNKVLAH